MQIVDVNSQGQCSPSSDREKYFSVLRRNLEVVNERIIRACQKAGRAREEVTLELAVKTRSADTIIAAGEVLRELNLPLVFGHNHVQEAVATNPKVRSALPEADIHFIGHLQTNKINHALREFDLFETIDSPKLLEKLQSRLSGRSPLPVYLEVNCSGEAHKHGIAVENALVLAKEILQCPDFMLLGFMTVAMNADEVQVNADFSRLRQIRDQVCALDLPGADRAQALSMGMSGDLELAIANGSSTVRIGTDVFGPRSYSG